MLDLIERLEKAEAGSRELDCEIGLIVRTNGRGEIVQWGNGEWVIQDAGGPYVVDDFTTSLDAALALAERVLPGWSRGVFEDEPGNQPPWLATLTEVCDARAVEGHEGAGATAPLALCIAILRALRTTEQHSPAQQKKEE